MKATKIIGKNVKGTAFDIPLAPVTIIVGDNASGKTAIAEAIKLCVLGYVPGYNKKPGDIFRKLGSGTEMSARLDFESPESNQVTLKLKNDSVKSDIVLDVKSKSILLDSSDYFSRTAAQRVAMLFERVAGGKADMLAGEIKSEFKSIRLDEHTPQAELIIAELCDDVDALDGQREEFEWSVPEFLSKVIDFVRSKRKTAADSAGQMRSSLKASVTLRVADGFAAPMHAIESEIASAEKRAVAFNAAIADAQRRIGVAESQASARLGAAKEVERHPDVSDLLSTAKRVCETTRMRVNEATAALPSDWKTTTAEASIQRVAASALSGARADYSGVVLKEERLKRSSAAEVDAERELGAMKIRHAAEQKNVSVKVCPHCGKPDETFLHALIAKHKESEDEMVVRVQRAIELAKTSALDLKMEKTNYEKASEELADAVRKADAEAKQAVKTAAEAQQAVDRLRFFETDLDKCRRLCQTLEAQDNLHSQAAKNFAALPEPEAIEPLNAKLADVRRDMAATDAELKRLRAEQKASLAALADVRRAEQAKAEAEAKDSEAEVCGAAVKKLVEFQERKIKDVISGFMVESGEVIGEVLGRTLEFSDGDIGYYRDGQWVSHESFSRLEQTLCYVGLCLAFAKDTPCKIVIVDEMGTIEPDNKRKFVALMHKMTATGKLDNFVGLDVTSRDYGKLPKSLLSIVKIDARKNI